MQSAKEKIVLGLGNNIDYEITWDHVVVQGLIEEYDIHACEISSEIPIANERDLVRSILGFVQSGGGGERYVAAPEIIERFAKRFTMKTTLGGTSVRAAIAMRKLGHTSALHLVTMNDTVRQLIPQDSPYICSSDIPSAYPHLIVQFSKGASVRIGEIDVCAPHANRIIYDNDYDNIVMKLDDRLGEMLTQARVFLISGFNAMQDGALLEERLQTLANTMVSLPKNTTVFYEDGCFCKAEFPLRVIAAMAKYIDIYSLNEDELQGYLGRKLDLTDSEQMQTALEQIRALIRVPVLVIHTRYWALAYGAQARRLQAALAGGITMATTRFQYGDDWTVENYEQTKQLPDNLEGARFAAMLYERMGEKVCCLPCKQVSQTNATTIGLGDSFVGGLLPFLVNL